MTESDARPAKRARLSQDAPRIHGDIINVEAGTGDELKIFHIYKEVLEKSPFFRNALKPEWTILRGDRPVDITDELPNAIDIYFSWLYSSTLREDVAWRIRDYISLYILGQKFMDDEFQNAVINGMVDSIRRSKSFPTLFSIRRIYDETFEDSPVRRLMVDLWCARVFVGPNPTRKRELPTDFMFDCMMVYASKNVPDKGKMSWSIDATKYHIARAGEGEEEIEVENEGNNEQDLE